MELLQRPAYQLSELLRCGEAQPSELIAAQFRRISDLNPRLNAIIGTGEEAAMAAAQIADAAQSAHRPLGPLHGIPVTIKSSVDAAGLPRECGSRLREGFRPKRNATLVQRLKQAGAIVVGSTNVPEFLCAWETDNALYGRTNSPWDAAYTPGGSSGGESAALAAGLSAIGIGSDGGGSIRWPAACCGLYGLKPTPGVIPISGHWPACAGPASHIGVVGPMTRSARDLETAFQVVAGPDPGDAASANVAFPPVSDTDLDGLRLGWFTGLPTAPVGLEIEAAVHQAVEVLTGGGLGSQPFAPPAVEDVLRAWWIYFGHTAAAGIAAMATDREEDISPITHEFVAFVNTEPNPGFDGLLDAWTKRDLLRIQWLRKMRDTPVIVCPVASIPAFRHGERSWTVDGKTVRYIECFAHCALFNLLGFPSVTIPVSRTAGGLPIGVQLVGRPYEEHILLALARRFEDAVGLAPMPDMTSDGSVAEPPEPETI